MHVCTHTHIHTAKGKLSHPLLLGLRIIARTRTLESWTELFGAFFNLHSSSFNGLDPELTLFLLL